MKKNWSYYVAPIFFTTRWNGAITVCILLFLCRFFVSWLGLIPYVALGVVVIVLVFDYVLLFNNRKGVHAWRIHADRLSNGDDNIVRIVVVNNYHHAIGVVVIDEIPFQFQRRDVQFYLHLNEGEQQDITYSLRPIKRGEYNFGNINLYITTPLSFLKRRIIIPQQADVPVYPSYLQMRKYQLFAISNKLTEVGVKKVRRLGHSMEFEQVKEYVQGDDYRTLNWKASARKGQLMVNNYTEEKSQQVYCVIDKGRVMKMPFEGMSLLDYAINTSLVLSNIALVKQDKAGLITFSEQVGTFLKASSRPIQMESILKILYHQKTRYLESDFEALYTTLRRKVNQRSLIVLFTNFESLTGMQRQMPFFKKIAAHHLLVVVFFENTELKLLVDAESTTVEETYVKIVAEQFALEKRMIAKELQQQGILSILTTPRELTINTLNKYLEIKALQSI